MAYITKGLDRLQPFLDLITSDAPRSRNINVMFLGSSSTAGWKAYDIFKRSYAGRLVQTMKSLAGDGGTFLFAAMQPTGMCWDDTTGASVGYNNERALNPEGFPIFVADYPNILASAVGSEAFGGAVWAAGIVYGHVALASVARNTAYTLGQLVLAPVANGRFYKCTTAGTTATPTAPAYPTSAYTGPVTDGNSVFTLHGDYPYAVHLPAGRYIDIFAKRGDAGYGSLIADIRYGCTGYPQTTNLSLNIDGTVAGTKSYGQIITLPDTGDTAPKTLLLECSGSEKVVYLDGIRVRPDDNHVGLVDYICGLGGQMLSTIATTCDTDAKMDHLYYLADNTQMDALVIQMGSNDYNAPVALATAATALRSIIQAAFRSNPDMCVVYLKHWSTAAHTFAVSDDMQQYLDALSDVAYSEGACIIDAGSMLGVNTPAEAATKGLLNADLAHLSDQGHGLIADKLSIEIGWPLTGRSIGSVRVTTAADVSAIALAISTELSTQLATIATPIETIKKVLINDRDTVGGTFPYTETVYDDDGTSSLESWTYTKNRSTEEKRRA